MRYKVQKLWRSYHVGIDYKLVKLDPFYDRYKFCKKVDNRPYV